MARWYVWRVLLVGAALVWSVACSDDVAPRQCTGEGCVSCDEDNPCEEGSYCDSEGRCQEQLCVPGESQCIGGDSVQVCDAEGTGFSQTTSCASGICQVGRCLCTEEAGCADGERCIGGRCSCLSATYCDGTCCGEDEVCGEVDGAPACVPACAGEYCGDRNEICCEGDNPVCGPRGECAPSCEGQGELCGENFEICCPQGDVCVFGECRTPGASCDFFSECDFGEYCDPALGRCMPDDFPEDLVCELEYDFDDFEPGVLWRWEGVEVGGQLHANVMMTPMVADVTGDGLPNAVFTAYRPGATTSAVLVVVDGESGETIYTNSTHGLEFGAQIALGDVDGDGRNEIAVTERGRVSMVDDLQSCPDPAADEDGCYLWRQSEAGIAQGSPLLYDVDDDGAVEVIARLRVLDGATGVVLVGRSDGYIYPTVIDIDGDGQLEILGAGCLWRPSLDHGTMDEVWCNTAELPTNQNMYSAMGDVVGGERAGMPEFVLTGNGNVYVVAAESGELLRQSSLPGGGNGGGPIVADFDGDGSGEFGIAGSGCYTVFDTDCVGSVDEDQPGCTRPEIAPCTRGEDCFEVEACPTLASSGGTGDGVLWSVYIQDLSSSRTGSSVFDFQGDGRNEVVYNDECLLMVFDGSTGSPQFRFPNTNRTSSEYPIIVDVNGDSRTNIVVSGNNDQFNRDCRDPINARPDRYPECHPEGDGERPAWCDAGTAGVVALQDPEDRWVRTRSVWNHFAYHIDNVEDDGAVVSSPEMPWTTHNTFRANRQGEVPLNAPDVAVTRAVADARGCPPEITFSVTVENLGRSAVPSGLPVAIYNGSGSRLIQVETIDRVISPGGTVQLVFGYEVREVEFNRSLDFLIVANDDGTGEAPVRDCNADNASVLIEDVVCTIVQ